MSNSNKVFRTIWRVNSVLILVAAGAIALLAGSFAFEQINSAVARRRDSQAAIRVDAPAASKLSLGRASYVEGTNVLRAELQMYGDEPKFSSRSYSSEKRNLLFIEPASRSAHWLLPDNQQVVTDTVDMKDEKESGSGKPVLATAALVKPADAPREFSNGRILIFDPAARKIVPVAENVREIQITSIDGPQLTIVYERDKKLIHATFDSKTFAKLTEQEIQIPPLK